jgi:hypothetical protein
MNATITDDQMTAESSMHYAKRTDEGWLVSWLPGRLVSRNQATTAMVLAEYVGYGVTGPQDKRWAFIESWAAELGISGADAVGEIAYYGANLALDSTWATCGCPEYDGVIRHLRNTCSEKAAAGCLAHIEDTETKAGPEPRLSISERGRFEWERALIGSRTMMPLARLVALVIALYSGADGCQGCWLSYADISRYSGLSINRVRQWVAVCEREGWIRRENGASQQGGGGSTAYVYYLAFPA